VRGKRSSFPSLGLSIVPVAARGRVYSAFGVAHLSGGALVTSYSACHYPNWRVKDLWASFCPGILMTAAAAAKKAKEAARKEVHR